MSCLSDAFSTWLAVIVAIASITFIGALIGIYVYKRKHNIPTGDCAYCHTNKNKILEEYHKKYYHISNPSKRRG